MLFGGAAAPRNPVGRSLWVRYRGDQVFHQRLVLAASLDGESVYICTPDFDDYLEDSSRANADLDAVHWSLPDGSPPDAMPRNSAYRFRAWPGPEVLVIVPPRHDPKGPRSRDRGRE